MCPLTPEQREEVEKAWAANRAMQAAMAVKRRMETGETKIELVGASDDLPVPDPNFQEELNAFSVSLHASSVEFSQTAVAFDSVDGGGYPLIL
jgi:hypothetical protein